MPVLEAGLLGLPVVASEAVPAAEEIGGADVLRFELNQAPHELAQRLLSWAEENKRLRLARRTRQNFSWQAIFRRDIEQLLVGNNKP